MKSICLSLISCSLIIATRSPRAAKRDRQASSDGSKVTWAQCDNCDKWRTTDTVYSKSEKFYCIFINGLSCATPACESEEETSNFSPTCISGLPDRDRIANLQPRERPQESLPVPKVSHPQAQLQPSLQPQHQEQQQELRRQSQAQQRRPRLSRGTRLFLREIGRRGSEIWSLSHINECYVRFPDSFDWPFRGAKIASTVACEDLATFLRWEEGFDYLKRQPCKKAKIASP